MTIGLRVNRPPSGERSFKAGAVLYGRVYLSVSKQPQPARSVLLKLTGKEDLVVHHTSQERRTDHHGGRTHESSPVTQDHYDHSTHHIFQMEYALKTFPGGTIPVGQYEFPFALQLPHTMPSSMTCRKGQSTCEVKFELVAEVHQQEPLNFPPFLSNLTAREELPIIATTQLTHDHNSSLHLPVDIIPITQCCCFPKGTMALETALDKTSVGVKDGIKVGFRCENKSTVAVHAVRIQLHEVIKWTSNRRTESVSTTLDEIILDAYQYPELERLHREPRRSRGDDYSTLESHDTRLDHQPWHAPSRPIVVPQRAKDTYDGRGIQVQHTITVELLTNGCCSSNPDATTLIQIYRKLASSWSDAQGGPCGTPSAPLEEADPLAPPTSTAPPGVYDEFYHEGTQYHYQQQSQHGATSAYAAVSSSAYNIDALGNNGGVIMVEAQALPPDWNAQTAEVVTIPMAEAIVIGVESTSSTPGMMASALPAHTRK
jgi:Arrestin (or S-antigen), N-terminal domain/Arrestin (or S-antigen), C-terminal domain